MYVTTVMLSATVNNIPCNKISFLTIIHGKNIYDRLLVTETLGSVLLSI